MIGFLLGEGVGAVSSERIDTLRRQRLLQAELPAAR